MIKLTTKTKEVHWDLFEYVYCGVYDSVTMPIHEDISRKACDQPWLYANILVKHVVGKYNDPAEPRS